MDINKFGGASIKSAERLVNVAQIAANNIKTPSLIVVSAMGKTTNALEKVLKSYASDDSTKAFELLAEVKENHYQVVRDLLGEHAEAVIQELNDTFVEIEWMIEEPSSDPFNYLYDQIVSVGELASSKIVNFLFQAKGLKAVWLDARDVIKTNNKYRNASIDWTQTKELVSKQVTQLFNNYDLVVTQGFIGCTSENFTTTLGREGSDFSAAIFATAMEANSMTVWKDVPGIMTADPSINDAASLLSTISYDEALAMTYFGAKVLHPKTIKPIQLQDIPLYVKSFVDPNGEGTVIKKLELDLRYPPITVVDSNNYFVKFTSKDNSFIREERLGQIFTLMNKFGLVLKLDRNTPYAFLVCLGDPYGKFEAFKNEAENFLDLEGNGSVDLLTVRHGDESNILDFLVGKTILLKEATPDTTQYVLVGS